MNNFYIFSDKQYDRLFTILQINKNKNVFFSLTSMIQIYMTKQNEKKLKDVIIIFKKENINKKKIIYYLKLLLNNLMETTMI